MQESQKINEPYPQNSTKSSKNGKLKIQNQHQDLEKNLQIDQFDLHSSNIALNITSSQTKNENKYLEGEENYVSRRDFLENFDQNNLGSQINTSQLDLLILKTERQKKNNLFRLNSTINPKINLYEKQQENNKMESQYMKRDSNLLKLQQKFTFDQSKAPQTNGNKLDCRGEGSYPFKDDSKQKKIGQIKTERRRSSSKNQEQFQSCIFNQIAKNLDESWLTRNNINSADWFVKYINSVYFSFISMVTVGYGDITPISLQEKAFVIFMVAYSCGVFGYIVSSIGNIFTERAQVQAKFKSQLADIIQYMRTRNIDQITQSQVFKYLDYLEKMDHYNHQKGEFTVQKLSPYLQKQIKINSYYPFLKKTNYFKLNFKDSILVNASLQIKELTFGPSQIIFHQNDFDNRLYFVLKGEVQLSVNNHKICIKNERDNCFGINEFFTGEARNVQAQSLTVSQILYLELSDFKEILKEDHLEYEKFSSLKDQAIFSKVSIDQSCFFCNKFSHMHDQCPFYTLKNQKLLIIERSKRSTDQLRQKIERVNLQKYNSLLQNQITKVNLKAIRLNYINNLAVDKHEIIQLVQNNIYDEDDIDFYRNYDAFEYIKHLEDERDEVTEFKQNIKLISSDQIADQFLSYEDITEKQQEEILESNIFVNSVNKFATSSIQAIENYTEEQKYVQILPFISSHNHQTKRNSIHKNFIQQQNVNAKERLSLIKEHNSLINIQNNQDQIQMKGPDSSTYLNENTKKNNNLLNQAHNLFELKKEKPNSDQGLDGKYIINQDGFFTINKFDQMQLYTRYFPKNNFNQVLQKYNKLSNKTQRIAFKKAKKQIIRKKNVSQNMYDFKQNNIKKAFLKCQTINSLQKKVFLEKQVKQLTINLDSNPKLGVQALMQDNQNDQKIQYQQQHNKQTDAEKSVFSNLNI